MSKSSLNNCHKCDFSATEGSDCANCKLAELKKRKKGNVNNGGNDNVNDNHVNNYYNNDNKRKFRIDDDDDPSISERLTENSSDHSILFLFIAATLTFVLVLLFTLLLTRMS